MRRLGVFVIIFVLAPVFAAQAQVPRLAGAYETCADNGQLDMYITQRPRKSRFGTRVLWKCVSNPRGRTYCITVE